MSKTHKDLNVGDEFWIKVQVMRTDLNDINGETVEVCTNSEDYEEFGHSTWITSTTVDNALANQPNTPTAPRTMKVIEWGEFPGVEFNAAIMNTHRVLHWSEGARMLQDADGNTYYPSYQELIQEATEVVNRYEFDGRVLDGGILDTNIHKELVPMSGKTVKVIVEALP